MQGVHLILHCTQSFLFVLVGNGFIITLWLTFINEENVMIGICSWRYPFSEWISPSCCRRLRSDVPPDSSFGSSSYMSFGCSRLTDSDSFSFLGNSESIISDSAVLNDFLLSVDPVWLDRIVVGVGWEIGFDSYCFQYSIVLSSMNNMSRLLTTLLSTRSHSL